MKKEEKEETNKQKRTKKKDKSRKKREIKMKNEKLKMKNKDRLLTRTFFSFPYLTSQSSQRHP